MYRFPGSKNVRLNVTKHSIAEALHNNSTSPSHLVRFLPLELMWVAQQHPRLPDRARPLLEKQDLSIHPLQTCDSICCTLALGCPQVILECSTSTKPRARQRLVPFWFHYTRLVV